MRVLAVVADLMDRTRIGAAATAAGVDLEVVADPASLAVGDADLVLVDLRLDGAIGAISGLPVDAPVVAFGAHVDTARLRAARAAGCRRVLARSVFFEQLPALLAPSAET